MNVLVRISTQALFQSDPNLETWRLAQNPDGFVWMEAEMEVMGPHSSDLTYGTNLACGYRATPTLQVTALNYRTMEKVKRPVAPCEGAVRTTSREDRPRRPLWQIEYPDAVLAQFGIRPKAERKAFWDKVLKPSAPEPAW